MSRIVSLEVKDWRPHPHGKSDQIQVKVEVPQKNGIKSTEWVTPYMHLIKRQFGGQGDNWDHLIGRKVRIKELEQAAEKMGYKMVRRGKRHG